MNKDEMKMIEEMAKIMDKSDEKCGNAGCFGCEYVNADRCVYILGATELYNAGYRKIADDEIVIKDEYLKEELRYLEYKTRRETAREILQTIENCGFRSLYDKTYGKHYKLTDYMIANIKHKYGI